MPDWTYHPLRPVASAALGERRTQLLAMRFLAALVTHAGGRRWIPRLFDHPPLPAAWNGRFGASVPPSIAKEAIAVLPVQGASVIEINPVRAADTDRLRELGDRGGCLVTAVADTPEIIAATAPYVDAVTGGNDPHTVRLTKPDIAPVLHALADPASTVLATPAVLIAAGPGWFNRVIEANIPTSAPPRLRDVTINPRRWPAWFWGLLVGAGMIVAGLGAGLIALGPVLLWYDRNYLGSSVAALHRINPHLIGFLQHDRITMAGNMIGIGVLYVGLSWGGIRQGHRWARNALLISGLPTFLTLFYFLATGFVEPLHTSVVIVLFPMFLIAVWRAPSAAHWPSIVEGSESERRRALWGQLLMIGIGGGLTVGGLTISLFGLTTVFVPTDLMFMNTNAEALQAANPHLLSFIAHDRAGFGGALIGAGLAVLLISMWGWRRGQSWVWWSLLLGCAFGTTPALIIHFAVGYTHFEHLLPVYVLVLAAATAFTLAAPYLIARTRNAQRGDLAGK